MSATIRGCKNEAVQDVGVMPTHKRLNKPFALTILALLVVAGGGVGYLSYSGREVPYDPKVWLAASTTQKISRCRMRHDLVTLLNQYHWNKNLTLARLGPADHVLDHQGWSLWQYDLGYPPGTLIKSGRALLEVSFDEKGELDFARTRLYLNNQ